MMKMNFSEKLKAMREILLSNQALSEFDEWLNTNTKIAKRILKMFKEMERSPFKGTANPNL